MPNSSERMLTCLADAFFDGRIAYVTQFFCYPLPVYRGDDLTVLGSPAALGAALHTYRAAAQHSGAVHMRPRVIAEGLPRKGRAQTWVEWDHIDADGRVLRSNQVRYAIRFDGLSLYPHIELVDYTRTAYPGLQLQTSAA